MNGSSTTLPLEVFTQKNSVADFIRFNFNFIHKNDKFGFWATLCSEIESSDVIQSRLKSNHDLYSPITDSLRPSSVQTVTTKQLAIGLPEVSNSDDQT